MEKNLTFYGQEERPWPNHLLNFGMIIGHTTTTSARIWVHVKDPGAYCLLISEVRLPDGVAVKVTEKGQHSVLGAPGVVSIRLRNAAVAEGRQRFFLHDETALKPDTQYWLALTKAEVGENAILLGNGWAHKFRTQKDNPAVLNFGLYSCHMPYDKGRIDRINMWERLGEIVNERQLSFLIGGGDQVYTDGDEELSIWRYLKKNLTRIAELPEEARYAAMLSWYREIYRGYWGHEKLRRVFASIPQYMVWDDHEIMDGWGSHTKKELANLLDTWNVREKKYKNLGLAREMFKAATQVYEEFQHCHNPPTQPGIYDYGYSAGAAHFYVLDMRGQRDFQRKEYRVLGRPQFERFAAWLKSLEALPANSVKAVFVVSTVPVVHLREWVVNVADIPWLGLADDLRDEWDHESNYQERNLLLDEMFSTSHKLGVPVAILSGDVHVGAAFELASNEFPRSRVYQLTSSAITYCKVPKGMKLLVRKEDGLMAGRPAGKKKAVVVRPFRNQVMVSNNFGVVQCNMEGEKAVIRWNLYGNSDDDQYLTRGPALVIGDE